MASAAEAPAAVELTAAESGAARPALRRLDSAVINLEEGYETLLRLERELWPEVPDVEITYNLTYRLDVPETQYDIPNVGKSFLNLATFWRKPPTRPFNLLADAVGRIRPGTLTLVLAPPGHGKSTILKTLAGRVPQDKLRGKVLYNGQPASTLPARLERLIGYVDQVDTHVPQLTVRETFEFALRTSVVATEHLDHELLAKSVSRRVDTTLKLLGLEECADTVVGNDLVRGVSGGQKKRVTIGEMLLGNARVMLLDEFTTGLDASTSFDIMRSLRAWAHVTNGSVVSALLQPTPETYACFDNVILLREGHVVYHGPREDLPGYFAAHGIVPPEGMDFADFLVEFLNDPKLMYERLRKAAKLAARQRAHGGAEDSNLEDTDADTQSADDESADDGRSPAFRAASRAPRAEIAEANEAAADAAVSAVSAVSEATKNEAEGKDSAGEVDAATAVAAATVSEVAVSADSAESAAPISVVVEDPLAAILQFPMDQVPLTTEALVAAFRKSTQFRQLTQESEPGVAGSGSASPGTPSSIGSRDSLKGGVKLTSRFAQKQYGETYARSFVEQMRLLLERQWRLTVRDTTFVGSRVSQSIFMGLVIGSLFNNLGLEDFGLKIGVALYAAIFLAFSNFAEIPIAVELKNVVYKQTAAGFYSTYAYACAVAVVTLPLILIEVGIFGTLLYWIVGLADDVGRYFFFLLMLYGTSLAMSVIFRCIAFVAPNMEIAQVFAGPTASIFLLFGGFLITRSNIHDATIWLYWLSPFSWIVRSLVQNEFYSEEYEVRPQGPGTPTLGEIYLDLFEIQTDRAYKWAGLGYILGIFLLGILGGGFILRTCRRDINVGSSRTSNEDDELEMVANARRRVRGRKSRHVAAAGEAPTSHALALPFTPVVLAFRGIEYAVEVKKDSKTGSKMRTLLRDVHGVARPGTLTALMGSSGAGKTTLMDVIAGRKTGGAMKGEIFVNGFPKEENVFRRLIGYVEQRDLHTAYMTVRESLLFAAKLRLPDSVPTETVIKFVDEVIELLELTPLADRLVGEEGNANALSPGQRKRLTIGVEMVANPSILFLDEPTSGLDSRAAATVMRVVRNIASTGRTVVATIHQPSEELFNMFDSLLLLQRGGKEVFFGPVGRRSRKLVRYFESIPGTIKCPRGMNPASWMLDVIGAGIELPNAPRVDTAAVSERADSAASATDTDTTSPTSALAATAAASSSSSSSATPGSLPPTIIRTPNFASIYEGSELRRAALAAVDAACVPAPGAKPMAAPGEGVYAQSFLYQFGVLLERFFLSYWRNVSYNFVRSIVLIFLGLLFGLVYYQVSDDDVAGIQSRLSVTFMTVGFCGVINYGTSLPVMVKERAVYYRERASNTYSSYAYSFALSIVELPWIFLASLFFLSTFYFMVGFKPDGASFFAYTLLHYLCSICFSYTGMLLAAALPNIQVAQIAGGALLSLFFLFGGIFSPEPSIPAGWHWFHLINPIGLAWKAMAVPEYECNSATEACPTIVNFTPTGPQVITKSEYISSVFGVDYGARWEHVGWLILWASVVRILGIVALRYVNHLKR